MTDTADQAAQLRAALRSVAESDRRERMRAAFVRASAKVKPARRRPERLTRTAALMLVSRAARPRPTAARAVATESGVERLDLNGEIGWDVTASEFSDRLRAIDAGTVELHVNSPGGSVFDGLQIFNELVDHPARVAVVVDGLAASAASFIAMAGDSVKVNRGAQFMVHDAAAMTFGNQSDHLKSAELLGRVSDTIAGIYANRAGGTAGEWRDLMRAETWFSPSEAVEAGLADVAVEDEPVPDGAQLRAALRAALR